MKFPINVSGNDLPYVERNPAQHDLSYLQVGSGERVVRSDQSGLWAGGGKFTNASFRVNMDGQVVAGDANITGQIQGESGYIGGWVIARKQIMSANRSVGMSSIVTGGIDWRFWAGSSVPSSAPFRVDDSGNMYATSGEIGGWVIDTYTITADGGAVGLSSEATAGTDWRIWAGNATPGSAPFRVDEDGNMYAESGEIGGWTINADTLESDDGDIVLDPVNKKLTIADGNDKIEILHDTGRGYIDFYDGGALKARLRATTLGSGGIRVVDGDFTINYDYSALFEESGGTNYARIGISSADDYLWFVAPTATDTFAFLNAAESSILTISHDSGTSLGNLYMPAGHIQLKEISTPGNPSADTGVIYTKDNGAGKTQLCVRFSSGAEQVIATEP